ncbi:hypothetical protein PR048_032959 [Dryococelus australis]|uniref:Uncharacterized protein n=1 Tax=Dryococelus australis TaxID=614101 RepID=A0ABQ9G3Q4_9NEOP|nr:hypothetical protein PR048_032959 [Dryococelus australis]
MSDCKQYQNLWKVVEVLLILNHGQATVEQGSSINKQVEVETLKEKSYIAQGLICYFLCDISDIEKNIASLTWPADELAQKAEDLGDMTLIVSSNALHWTAKEKTTQLENLKKAIACLECS